MKVLGCVAVALLVGLLSATAHRVHLWTDGERFLWAEAVQKSPLKPRPWVNLGNQYASAGLENLAEDMYQQASVLAQDPRRLREEKAYGFALAQANIAILEAKRGDMRGAVVRLRRVTSRYPVTSVQRLQRWYERQLATP